MLDTVYSTADGTTGMGGIDGASAPGRLRVRGLTLEIAGRRLIDGFDLDLAPGTLSVVMGANGSGKTLLLRLLHGLIAPDAGDIRWGGKVMSDAVRRDQAMVFQRPVLLRRSVAANIEFVLKGPRRRRRERAAQALRGAGLLDKARQPARLLSGGEQQRLALARALALRPRVLFLDEPSASLDPASQLAIEDAVLEAHAGGTKVIFVTHDPGQARRLADDVVFLHRGRLVEHTPAQDFFNAPQSEAARAFLDGKIFI